MARTKVTEDAVETVVETIEPLTYSKRVIVDYYTHHKDFLNVVLDSEKLYTIEQVESLLKEMK